MGDVSIIPRQLSDKYVQYGWSGNGGYFKAVGARLLEWYNTPDMVEYLFGLGQLVHLWKPHSEEYAGGIQTVLDRGIPHWVDPSERWIFSKIAFIDYGYFYDADQNWYYVKPGPFRLKIPLTLVAENLNEKEFEFSFLHDVERLVFEKLFDKRHAELLERAGHDRESLQEIRKTLDQEESPLYKLWCCHKSICDCFDDWVVIRPDESGEKIGEIILRPKEEQHTETIFWQ